MLLPWCGRICLLLLSGDAEANPAASHEADKLAALTGAADAANAQAALGVIPKGASEAVWRRGKF